MKKIITIIITLTMFTGCSSVRQAVKTETKTEIKEIPVPMITAKEIPGIYQMEIPIDSMYTGEVITGKIKDITGNTIAVINYRPKKMYKADINDTAGTFDAVIKPAPVKAEVKIETTEIKNTKENSMYDMMLIVAGIVLVILIIKFLK